MAVIWNNINNPCHCVVMLGESHGSLRNGTNTLYNYNP